MNRWLPFWIADPVGAERKLDRLASDGYRLTKMNFCGFCTFDKGESRTVRHRIVLERGGLPHGAAERGWEPLYNGRLFYVTAHEDEKETISYGAHKKLHSIAKTLIFFVICFFFGILLGGTLAALDDMALGEFYGSPDTHKALAGFAVSLGVLIHFHIGTKRMPSDGLGLGGKMKTVPAENFIYDKKTEKQLIREGQVKRVLKPGWFYAPDKGEEYVRDMAAQGWIFYRFDEMGVTFYFRKGEPRKLKFVVDYQNHADEGYFNTAKEYGWKLEFTSMTRTMGFTMWSKYWDDEEEEPEFYSDAESE
ncbi:MAG: DUF2812 domain-containing protein, partial [Oscillospiraceae bacterium]|nr:DUF2812 domain-containing protein [Oscillospiraceae bacterium]